MKLDMRYKNFQDLMNKIHEAEKMSAEKQNVINEKKANLREETRIVVVEEGKEEIARLEAEKVEFDKMTQMAIARARTEIEELKKQVEEEHNAKLVKIMEGRRKSEDADLSDDVLNDIVDIVKKDIERIQKEVADQRDYLDVSSKDLGMLFNPELIKDEIAGGEKSEGEKEEKPESEKVDGEKPEDERAEGENPEGENSEGENSEVEKQEDEKQEDAKSDEGKSKEDRESNPAKLGVQVGGFWAAIIKFIRFLRKHSKEGSALEKWCDSMESKVASHIKALPVGRGTVETLKATVRKEKEDVEKTSPTSEEAEKISEELDKEWIMGKLEKIGEDKVFTNIAANAFNEVKKENSEREEKWTNEELLEQCAKRTQADILMGAEEQGITLENSDGTRRPIRDIYEDLSEKLRLQEATNDVSHKATEEHEKDDEEKEDSSRESSETEKPIEGNDR